MSNDKAKAKIDPISDITPPVPPVVEGEVGADITPGSLHGSCLPRDKDGNPVPGVAVLPNGIKVITY